MLVKDSLKQLYGSVEANSRIPILKKEGSESSAQQMDRVHAWYQPVVNFIIFICVDNNNYKAIETLNPSKSPLK